MYAPRVYTARLVTRCGCKRRVKLYRITPFVDVPLRVFPGEGDYIKVEVRRFVMTKIRKGVHIYEEEL